MGIRRRGNASGGEDGSPEGSDAESWAVWAGVLATDENADLLTSSMTEGVDQDGEAVAEIEIVGEPAEWEQDIATIDHVV